MASFETCPRRTLHGLKVPDDLSTGNMEASADLGSAFHAVVAEILRTLYRQGEQQMPTQEAVEVMYEVMAGGKWVLPADERDTLRSLILSFASYYRWDTRRILALEERLETEIACPDGKTRILTGQPDVLIADPPDGIIIVDYKTGRAVPRSPRKQPEKGEAIVGKEYLSERGHFQLDIYGLLAMRRYPRAQRAILRELHMRSGERREAVLGRDELEHVEREVALHMMLLDRAITEGEGSELWRPRPGRHCARRCPVARSCPIPAEQRGVGALETPNMADAEAKRYVAVDGLRTAMRDALKAWHEGTGHFVDVGDGYVMGWHETGHGRRFEVFAPEPVQTTDFEEAFMAAAERGAA